MQRGAKGGRHRDLWPGDAPGIQLLVKTVSSPLATGFVQQKGKKKYKLNEKVTSTLVYVQSLNTLGRDALKEILRDYLGIFPNRGGSLLNFSKLL